MINTGRSCPISNIDKVEKTYNAKWVGQLCLRTKSGEWAADSYGDVYFQETPPVEGYSQYFALIVQDGSLYITSGASAVEGVIVGIEADDGEIIYSRCRHDYRVSKDNSVWIDGGRDYVRSSPGKLIMFKIIDGNFVKLDEDVE